LTPLIVVFCFGSSFPDLEMFDAVASAENTTQSGNVNTFSNFLAASLPVVDYEDDCHTAKRRCGKRQVLTTCRTTLQCSAEALARPLRPEADENSFICSIEDEEKEHSLFSIS
jgi:hypothetical protein